jgi:glutathione S-transferase
MTAEARVGRLAAPRTTLYVIPTHPCRTAMLMLEHKGIPYRQVELPAPLHPLALRLHGFPGNAAPFRDIDDRPHRVLALADRMGTVPALRLDGNLVMTNRDIARFLDKVQPDPPLFPAEPDRRLAVEEAERWGDEIFQMAARRLLLASALRGRDGIVNRGEDGRLGPLISRRETVRFAVARLVARFAFAVNARSERDLLAALPGIGRGGSLGRRARDARCRSGVCQDCIVGIASIACIVIRHGGIDNTTRRSEATAHQPIGRS